MAVEWRPPGGVTGSINLADLEGDQIVIHYGGSLTSVDAYTFVNSLVAFADTVRAVNASINPGQNIEIRLEAVGPGSFRAVVRRIKKGFGGFFSRGDENARPSTMTMAALMTSPCFILPSLPTGRMMQFAADDQPEQGVAADSMSRFMSRRIAEVSEKPRKSAVLNAT